eukprot:TRINITY_DN2528_c0_g2_i1.p1 TRINITY_DN2528_c0_g2~~TRINITY_DN2528_c0_g2_i1.p1  ORF type:complete len:1129 (-),score=254.30 TRINITY_DN2528_c0_g2_i1:61-3447(-)
MTEGAHENLGRTAAANDNADAASDAVPNKLLEIHFVADDKTPNHAGATGDIDDAPAQLTDSGNRCPGTSEQGNQDTILFDQGVPAATVLADSHLCGETGEAANDVSGGLDADNVDATAGEALLEDKELPPVQICVRVRPLLSWEQADGQCSSALELNEGGKGTDAGEGSETPCIRLKPPNDVTGSGSSSRVRNFRFDAVIGGERSQQDAWDLSRIDGVVNKVALGFHATIFAYGQTGTGKTHTMEGFSYEHHNGHAAPTAAAARPKANAKRTPPEKLGIVPRAIEALFARADALRSRAETRAPGSGHNSCVVRLSFLQIYNEKIFDLLNPSLSVAQRESGGKGEEFSGLRLRWDAAKRQFFVENLFQYECSSAEEAMQHYQNGVANKHVASTAMNVASSRSHTLLVLTLLRREGLRPSDATSAGAAPPCQEITSRLALVDLAGSERTAANGGFDKSATRFNEAVNVNQSLFVLRKVITALSKRSETKQSGEGSSVHVPYRESKLTSLLQHSLGGNSFLVMFACLAASDKHYEENLSTLQYASQAACIKNQPSVNIDPKDRLIKQLEAKLAAAHGFFLRALSLPELPPELLGAEEAAAAAAAGGGPRRSSGPPRGKEAGQVRRTKSAAAARGAASHGSVPRTGGGSTTPPYSFAGSEHAALEVGYEAASFSSSLPGCKRAAAPKRMPMMPSARAEYLAAAAAANGGGSSSSSFVPGGAAAATYGVSLGSGSGSSNAYSRLAAAGPLLTPREGSAAAWPGPGNAGSMTSRSEGRELFAAVDDMMRDYVPRSSARRSQNLRGSRNHASLPPADVTPRRSMLPPVESSPRSGSDFTSAPTLPPPLPTALLGAAASGEGSVQSARGARRSGPKLPASSSKDRPGQAGRDSPGSATSAETAAMASTANSRCSCCGSEARADVAPAGTASVNVAAASAATETAGLWEAVEELKASKAGLQGRLTEAQASVEELQRQLLEAQSTKRELETQFLEAQTQAKEGDQARSDLRTLSEEAEALRKERAELQQRLDVFYCAIELENSASKTDAGADSGDVIQVPAGPSGDQEPFQAELAAGLGQKIEKLHTQLVMEAMTLRNDISRLKKKKAVLKAVLDTGGEHERRAIDEDIEQLRLSKK